MVGPREEEGVSELLVEVPTISHESRREENISSDGGHLALECLTARFPPCPLATQAGEKGLAALHLNERSIKGSS